MLYFILRDLEELITRGNKNLNKDARFRRSKNKRPEQYAYWYGYYKQTAENLTDDLRALINTYEEIDEINSKGIEDKP